MSVKDEVSSMVVLGGGKVTVTLRWWTIPIVLIAVGFTWGSYLSHLHHMENPSSNDGTMTLLLTGGSILISIGICLGRWTK